MVLARSRVDLVNGVFVRGVWGSGRAGLTAAWVTPPLNEAGGTDGAGPGRVQLAGDLRKQPLGFFLLFCRRGMLAWGAGCGTSRSQTNPL